MILAVPAGLRQSFPQLARVESIKLSPGEFVATDKDIMLVTVLGSCVAVCLHDAVRGTGGMNHFMLPDTDTGGAFPFHNAGAAFGVQAMELLISELLKLGSPRAALEAKVFGGGSMVGAFTKTRVGESNAEFILRYLANEGIRLVAQDLLGTMARKVYYSPRTGCAAVKYVDTTDKLNLIALEKKAITVPQSFGSVELF